MRFIPVFTSILFVFVGSVRGADFYIDPVRGSDANDGSINRPWQTLGHVFETGLVASRQWESLPYKEGKRLVPKNAGAPIRAGDTIWLHSGYYGELMIGDYYNRDFITIAAMKGHTPRFRQIRVRSGSHWVLMGLHVSPAFGEGKKPRNMIGIESHGFRGPVSHVVVEDCVLASAQDTAGWTAADWNRLSCSGIGAGGSHIIIRNNHLKNVNFGISVDASHSLIEHNVVENFAGDGLRGLGDHSVFQYNIVKNCYDVNDNHDDGFQSWSRNGGRPGRGEVVGLVLRGNTIINYEDPAQPHRGTLQGIGCFDGMYVDWVVENNAVLVDHWHGITLLGARSCRIVNNTVMDLNERRPGPPWIRIDKHKDGTPSADCVMRNNLTTSLKPGEGTGMVVDHNMIIEDAGLLFVDASGHDLRLKEGNRAIDAGPSALAPENDILGTSRPQGEAVDAGAYERPANQVSTQSNAQGEKSKPNVIVFYVDDMGWAGLGCYGCDFIDTPEIDRLAADGVRFTDAYSPAPNCSPSRASLLTGLYPPRHGITQYLPGNKQKFRHKPVIQADLPPGLDPDFTTIAEVFRANGYATASMGKWHLGGEAFYPDKHGFDVNIGGTSVGHHSRVFPPYLKQENALDGRPGEHITQCLLRHTLNYIDGHADRPFFLYLPFYAVHRPWGGSKDLEAKYAERFPGDKDRIAYAAMTEGVDRFIGAVRDRLKDRGIEKRTILVFSSDNGGAFRPTCKGLREMKGYIYEGGLRVPCIFAGRGIQAGQVDETPISQIDFLPTLAALAGIAGPACDGVNLQPILDGSGDMIERDLFWHYPHYANSGGKPGSVIRSGDYKLIHWYEDDSWALYDLRNDPGETDNIAAEKPEITAKMRKKLTNWLHETGAIIPARNK